MSTYLLQQQREGWREGGPHQEKQNTATEQEPQGAAQKDRTDGQNQREREQRERERGRLVSDRS